MASRSNHGKLATGHKAGLELIRARLKDSDQSLQTQYMAAEMLVRFWRREAESALSNAELAAIETLADHGADVAWNALLKVGGKTFH